MPSSPVPTTSNAISQRWSKYKQFCLNLGVSASIPFTKYKVMDYRGVTSTIRFHRMQLIYMSYYTIKQNHVCITFLISSSSFFYVDYFFCQSISSAWFQSQMKAFEAVLETSCGISLQIRLDSSNITSIQWETSTRSVITAVQYIWFWGLMGIIDGKQCILTMATWEKYWRWSIEGNKSAFSKIHINLFVYTHWCHLQKYCR